MLLEGERAFFEVKEWAQAELPKGFGFFDPYGPIREKIAAAQKQLHPHKGQMCSVVLCNVNNTPLISFDEMTVFGAMLGNPGITFPVNQAGFLDTEAKSAFLGGGRMVRYDKTGQPVAPQNTAISAVVGLSTLAVGQRRAAIQVHEWERELGHKLPLEEFWPRLESLDYIGQTELRVVVYENPYAVRRLSSTFATGPWDERYGPDGGHLARLFVGRELEALEAGEAAARVGRHGPLGLS